METEISYKTYNAKLEKTEENKWALQLYLDDKLTIFVSEEKQEYLTSVFNTLIQKMIEEPFNFMFVASNEDDAKGLNEVCEKYIAILNNDLKGVYEEYQKGVDDILNNQK